MNKFLLTKFQPRFQYLIELRGLTTAIIRKKTGIYTKKMAYILAKKSLPNEKQFQKILEVLSISEDDFWALKVKDSYQSDNKVLGMRMQFFRREKGMSRADLARKLVITDNSIPSYEKGIKKPTQQKLLDILTALDVDLDTFWKTDICDQGDEIPDYNKNSLFQLKKSTDKVDQKFIEQFIKFKNFECLSNSAIACLLDVHPQQIIDMENGLIEPTQELYKKILVIFNVTEDYFYNTTPQRKTKKSRELIIKNKNNFPLIMLSIRLKKGLNKKDFARFLGVDYSLILKYEFGKSLPTYKVFNTILSALNMTKEELFSINVEDMNINSLDDLGLRIKYFRIQSDLLRLELANKAGIHEYSIRNYEKGVSTPSMLTVFKIIQALDISSTVFFDTDINSIKEKIHLDKILKIHRKKCELTKKEFAQQVDIPLLLIVSVENGEDTLSERELEKIYTFLKISEQDFWETEILNLKKA